MKDRKISVNHVGPDHPPMRRSAGTIGMKARDEGGVSTVLLTIDLGLKNHELGEIRMSVEDAVRLADDVLRSAVQAMNANNREVIG